MAMTEKVKDRAVFKAQMMTMTVLLIFILMFAVMFIFALINIQYNRIAESVGPASASVSLATVLKQGAYSFANISAQTAATAISYYAYNSSLSGTNTLFNVNMSSYFVNLITNGTLPIQPLLYVTNQPSGNVVVINTATNTVISTLTQGFSSPAGIAFAPSGAYGYIVNAGSGNVVILNTVTNSIVGAIIHGFSGPYGVTFTASGAYAYVTNAGSNNVVIINTATNSVVGAISGGFNGPGSISIAPSGTYAYVVNSANVVIVNLATNTVVGAITTGITSPTGVAFAPSGAYAYVTEYSTSNSVVVNTTTNTVTGTIPVSYAEDAVFRNSAYAYISSYGYNKIDVLNIATNTVVNTITAGINGPFGVALAPVPVNVYFKRALGSLNLKSYNATVLSNFSNTGLVSINETGLKVIQRSPFNFYLSYLENVKVNQTYGVSNYSIPVNLTVGGFSYYVPITLTNSQGSGTGGAFQQMLTINSLAYYPYITANWTNVEFTTGNAASGNVLQAWVESNAISTATNTVVWVKVQSGIPASSSVTIYMNFMPYSVMSNGGPTGEAPQLSASYGKYDNGANVFSYYDGFKGNTLSPIYTLDNSSTLKQNNGLVITTTSGGPVGGFLLNRGFPTTTTTILDALINSFSCTTDDCGHGLGIMATQGGFCSFGYMFISGGESVSYGDLCGFPGGATSTPAVSIGTGIEGVAWISSSSQAFYKNYVVTTGTRTDASLPSSMYYQVGIPYEEIGTMSVQWIRVRNYPPGDVMPSQMTGNFV